MVMNRVTIIKKLTSLVILLIFLVNVAIGDASVILTADGIATDEHLGIEVPGSLAIVREEFFLPLKRGTMSAPLIVIIQDAHGNLEAQENIEGLLAYLSRAYGIDDVFLEGAAGMLEPGKFDFSESRELNEKAWKMLFERGVLSGADRHVLKQDSRDTVMGVEDESLYARDLSAFREVLDQRNASEAFVEGLSAQLELLGSHYLAKDLRGFLRSWWKYEKGDEALIGFCKKVVEKAKEACSVDLGDYRRQVEWPQLTRMAVLLGAEEKLDRDAAGREKTLCIQEMKEKGVNPGIVGRFEDSDGEKSLRVLFERVFDDPAGGTISMDQYPALMDWARICIFKQEMSGEPLYEELNRMSGKILRSMAGTAEEKEIVSLYEELGLVRKLFRLELSRKDWDAVRAEVKTISPAAFGKRLEELAIDLSGRVSARRSKNERRMELLFHRALKFYVLARERDRVFIDIALGSMKERKKNKAVLVTGGFHAEGLKRLMKESGIAFVDLQPIIRQELKDDLYLRRMKRASRDYSTSQISAPDPLQSERALAKIPGEKAYLDGEVADVLSSVGISGEKTKGQRRETRDPTTGKMSVPIAVSAASLGAESVSDSELFKKLQKEIPAEAFEALKKDVLADQMLIALMGDENCFRFPRNIDDLPVSIDWEDSGQRSAWVMTLLASGAVIRDVAEDRSNSGRKSFWDRYAEIKGMLSVREFRGDDGDEIDYYRMEGDELIREGTGTGEDWPMTKMREGYFLEHEIPLGFDTYLLVTEWVKSGWRDERGDFEVFVVKKTETGYRILKKIRHLKNPDRHFEMGGANYGELLARSLESGDDSAGFADAVRRYFADGVWAQMGIYGQWEDFGHGGIVFGTREIVEIHDNLEDSATADDILRVFGRAYMGIRDRIPSLKSMSEREGVQFFAWSYLGSLGAMRYSGARFIPLGAEAYRKFGGGSPESRTESTQEEKMFEQLKASPDLWKLIRRQYAGKKTADQMMAFMRHVRLIRNLNECGSEAMELLEYWSQIFTPENYDTLVMDVLGSSQSVQKAMEKRRDALLTPKERTKEILIALHLIPGGDVLNQSPESRELWGNILLAYLSRPDVSFASLKKRNGKEGETVAGSLQKLTQSVGRFEAMAGERGWGKLGLRNLILSWVRSETLTEAEEIPAELVIANAGDSSLTEFRRTGDRWEPISDQETLLKSLNLMNFYLENFALNRESSTEEWLSMLASEPPGIGSLVKAGAMLGPRAQALSELFAVADSYAKEGWKDPHILKDLLEGDILEKIFRLYDFAQYGGGAADVRELFVRYLDKHTHYWSGWFGKFVDELQKFRSELTEEYIDAHEISLAEQADLMELMKIEEFRKRFGEGRSIDGLRLAKELRDPMSGVIYQEKNDDHRIALFSLICIELRRMGRLPGEKEKEAQGIDYGEYFTEIFLERGQANRRDQYGLIDVMMPRGFQWAPRGVILGLLALFNDRKVEDLKMTLDTVNQSAAISFAPENLEDAETRAMGLLLWVAGIAKNKGMTMIADDLFCQQAREFLSLPQSRRFLNGEIDRKVARNLFGDTRDSPTPLDSSRSYYLNGSSGLFYFYRYFPVQMKEWMTGFMSNGLNEERLRPYLNLFGRLATEDVLSEWLAEPALAERLKEMDANTLVELFVSLNGMTLAERNANYRKARGEPLWRKPGEVAEMLDAVSEIKSGGEVDYREKKYADALYVCISIEGQAMAKRDYDAAMRNLFSFKNPEMELVMSDNMNEADPVSRKAIIEGFAKSPLKISPRVEEDFVRQYREAEGNPAARREMLDALLTYRYFGRVFQWTDRGDKGHDDWDSPWTMIEDLEREWGISHDNASFRRVGDSLIPEQSRGGFHFMLMGMMGPSMMKKRMQDDDRDSVEKILDVPLGGGKRIVALEDYEGRRMQVCLVEDREDGALKVLQENEVKDRARWRGRFGGSGFGGFRFDADPWGRDVYGDKFDSEELEEVLHVMAEMIQKEGLNAEEYLRDILIPGFGRMHWLDIGPDGMFKAHPLMGIAGWRMHDLMDDVFHPIKWRDKQKGGGDREAMMESLKPIMQMLEDELKGPLSILTGEEREKFLLILSLRALFGGRDGIVMSPEAIRQFRESLRGESAPLKDPYPTVRELMEAREALREGRFDPDSRDHRYANFIALQQQLDSSTVRREVPWDEYLTIVEKGKAGKTGQVDQKITEEQRFEVRGLVYEAVLMREEILKIQERAEELGRPVVLVENLSYGAVATSPITEERNGTKYIIGTDIPVISTKIGSTECHNDEFYTRKDLFTETERELFLRQKPIVIVVDASTSVSDPERTSPHIPDGFKGYRNYFMALDRAQGKEINPEDFLEDAAFLSGLGSDERIRELVEILKEDGVDPETEEPYQLRFWYPGDKQLYLRVGKKVATPAPKLMEAQEITGPALIFMEAAIDVESIGKDPRYEFVTDQKGKKHHPAHFDDKDHFKEFYLDYENGNGVVMSRAFINIARRYFQEFVEKYGAEQLPEMQVPEVPMREIDTVVLDLDETVVKTDKPLADNPAMLATLIALVKKGKKLMLITEDIEQNLDARLADLIAGVPGDCLSNITVFSEGGTKGYTFAADRSKVYLEAHNAKSRISSELRTQMLDLLGASELAGKYELDTRPERVSPEYRIDLRNLKMDRNEFISKAAKILNGAGIKAKVYKTGRTSIKIVLQHKEHALKYRVASDNIDPARMLVIGDSARMNQVDREMLVAYPESVSVTVGRFATTIAKDNPNIVQLTDEGIAGTQRLLGLLNMQGALPGWLIAPTGIKPIGESHIEGKPDKTKAGKSLGKRTEQERIVKDLGLEVHDRESGSMGYMENYRRPELNYGLTMVAHGQTDGNQRKVYSGWSDAYRLTPEGFEETRRGAEEWWAKNGPDFIADPGEFVFLTSPLTRTKQTFEVYRDYIHEMSGIRVEPIADPSIIEMDFAGWDGLTKEEISEQLGDEEAARMEGYNAGHVFVRPTQNGESVAMLMRRIHEWLAANNSKYQGKNIVAFSHGAFTRGVEMVMRTPAMPEKDGAIDWRSYHIRRGVPIDVSEGASLGKAETIIGEINLILRKYERKVLSPNPNPVLMAMPGMDLSEIKEQILQDVKRLMHEFGYSTQVYKMRIVNVVITNPFLVRLLLGMYFIPSVLNGVTMKVVRLMTNQGVIKAMFYMCGILICVGIAKAVFPEAKETIMSCFIGGVTIPLPFMMLKVLNKDRRGKFARMSFQNADVINALLNLFALRDEIYGKHMIFPDYGDPSEVLNILECADKDKIAVQLKLYGDQILADWERLQQSSGAMSAEGEAVSEGGGKGEDGLWLMPDEVEESYRKQAAAAALGAQELAKEFMERFPENYEMMLAMFGEILLAEPELKPFFDRITACFKKPIHEENAAYLASLLRTEKDSWFQGPLEFMNYEDEEEDGRLNWKSIAYEELDEEFLNWAVKRDILFCDFAVAYSHFLKMKQEQKNMGNVTPIRPGRKLGDILEKRIREYSVARVKTPLTMYKGDFIRPGMKFVNIERDQRLKEIAEDNGIGLDDLTLGVSGGDGEYQIYVFTRDPEMVRKTSSIAKRPVSDKVATVFAEVRIENGVPFVHIFQPWIYVYHAEMGELKELDRYVDGSMALLMHLLQNQISNLLQSETDYPTVRFATPAWHMTRTHIAETTAQRHYWKIPRKEGFRLKVLDDPIILMGYWKISYVLEKEQEAAGESLGPVSEDNVRFSREEWGAIIDAVLKDNPSAEVKAGELLNAICELQEVSGGFAGERDFKSKVQGIKGIGKAMAAWIAKRAFRNTTATNIEKVNILGVEHEFDAGIWDGISFAKKEDAGEIYELSKDLKMAGGIAVFPNRQAVENQILRDADAFGMKSVFMVYREKGRVAGYLLGGIVEETGIGKILQIVVGPEYRKRGVGYALNGKFLKYAAEEFGITKFMRFPIHDATKRMSVRFGFKPVDGKDVPAFVTGQKIYALNAGPEDVVRQAMRDEVGGTLELIQRAVRAGSLADIENLIWSSISQWMQVNRSYLKDRPMRVYEKMRRIYPELAAWINHPYFARVQELLSLISMRDLEWVRDVNGKEVPGFDPAVDLIEAVAHYCVRGEEMRQEVYETARAGDLGPLARYWHLRIFNSGKEFGQLENSVRIEEYPEGIRVTWGRDVVIVRHEYFNRYVNGESLGKESLTREYQMRLARFLEKTYRAEIDDIDGNLTQPGSDLPAADAIDAIQRRIRNGIPSGIASGRVERVATPEFQAMGVHDVEEIAERVRNGLSPEWMPRFVLFPENASYAAWMEWDDGKREYVRREVDLVRKYGIIPSDFEFTIKEREEIYREMGELMERDLPEAFKLREDKRYGFAAWVNGKPEWSPDDLRAFVNEAGERIQAHLQGHPNLKFRLLDVVTTGITVDVMVRGVDKSLAVRFFADQFGIGEHEIVATDDKGGKRGNGWPLTRHAAGVSTDEFNVESENQISLRAAWGVVGADAWLRLQSCLAFESPEGGSLGKTDIPERSLQEDLIISPWLKELLPALNGGASTWAVMMTAICPCKGFIRPDYPLDVAEALLEGIQPAMYVSETNGDAPDGQAVDPDPAILEFNRDPGWIADSWRPAGMPEEFHDRSAVLLEENVLAEAGDEAIRDFSNCLNSGDLVMVFWDGAGKRAGTVAKPPSIVKLINILSPRGVRVMDIPTLEPTSDLIERRIPKGLGQGVFVSTQTGIFKDLELRMQCEKFFMDKKQFAIAGIAPLQAVRLLKEIISIGDEDLRMQRYHEIGGQKDGDHWVLDAEGLAGFIRSAYAAWQAKQQIAVAA